jgi:hypothetical protein
MADPLREAGWWRRHFVAHGSAFFIFVMVVGATGCRDTTVDSSATVPGGPPVVTFVPGDTLIFDSWALNGFGDRIAASQTSVLWRVVDTGGTAAGKTRITTIIEQAGPGAPPIRPDTLMFQFRSDGDIYQYGFLARSVRIRENRIIPFAWDRIAAFSLPAGGTWIVGAQDTGGTDLVQGRVLDDRSFFSVSVNGVETLFRGYSVTMVGTNYEYGFTIAAPPPAMVVQQEDPGPVRNGRLRILNTLRVHGWP